MRKNKKQTHEQAERAYLDTLQRESWHLELIISGLALFGLIGLRTKFQEFGYINELNTGSFFGPIIMSAYLIIFFSIFIVFTNLVIHLLLRGLWIGAVGLRSVSGDIDFYQLKLAKPFSRFLKRRIGSFDDYILRLDRLCSMIFAFSFLLVLLLISFTLFFLIIAFFSYCMQRLEFLDGKVLAIFTVVVVALYLVGGFIYFIDFITLGWIKRRKWLARFYYPAYRFFGFVTLARIYRPLYYNFIDNVRGKRLIQLGLPYLILLIFGASITFTGFGYYDTNYFRSVQAQQLVASENNYDNLRDPESTRPRVMSLSADIITKPVVKVNINLLPKYAAVMAYKYPNLNRFHEAVLQSDIVVGFNKGSDELLTARLDSIDYLPKYRSIFQLRLDSMPVSLDDAVLFRPDAYPFPSLVKYLSLDNVPSGLHNLELTTYEYRKSQDTIREKQLNIPFFYQPE